MPADPDDLFDSFRDQLTGPGARSHSAPPAPGPEHVGRLVVRCPGCGEERWYGYGQCSRCGAPGPAVEVGGVVELDPLRWLVVDPVPDSPVIPDDPLAHLDPRAGHEAFVARQDPRESAWARDPTLWARERLGVHLWSKQRDLLLSLRDHHQTAVYTAHNIGKGLALDTPLPTPSGWTTIGRVCPGDTLYDELGRPTRVLWVSPVRERPCYRVRFTDGAELVCDDEHLWSVLPRSDRYGFQGDHWREAWDQATTLSAEQLASRRPGARDGVPVAGALEGRDPDGGLPIPPYLLGVWLGDGSSTRLSVGVHEDDVEILEHCSTLWPDVVESRRHRDNVVSRRWTTADGTGNSRTWLRQLGLYGHKHVPEVYLRASYEARLELLRGLMDTDGGAPNGRAAHVSIMVTDKELAVGIYELVCSLGWRAGWRERTGLQTRRIDRQVGYCVGFTVPRGDPNPFHLRRKAAKLVHCGPRATLRTIKSVEEVPSVPTRCLAVDSPRSLFLAGRAMVPTHNSFSAAVAALWWIDTHRVGEAFVVTTAPSSAQVRAILWREIGRHHARAGLSGRVNLTSEWYVGSELVAMGRKPPDYKEDAFQGIHARYVLVIFDEATGVPRLLWDAASTLTSNDESRFLAIGNPDDRHTAFGDACEDPTLAQDWNRIQISAHDTPNFTGEPVTEHVAASLVTPRWAEQRKRLWGEHSSIYQSKVLGRFPQDVDDGAVPYSWAQACRALELVDEEPVCAGLDVAGTGQDRTVLRERRGRRAGRERVWQEESDTVALATDIALSLREWGAKRIVVDAEGVGHGMVSELQRLSTRHRADLTVAMHDAEVVAFRAAGRPTLTADGVKFLNLRAQLYWVARELSRLKLWDLGAVDDDDVLAELCAPRYEVVPASGKIKVEAKKEVKKRLGVSPDRAEALLLAFWEAHGEASLPAGARVLTGTSYATERQPLTLPGDREPAPPRDPAEVEREAELVRELLLERSLT